jgi:hypothetical protein
MYNIAKNTKSAWTWTQGFFYMIKVQLIIRNYQIKKPLCPISNASMYNIAKNTKSAWTWTQVVFLYDQGSIHYQN